MSLRRSYTLIAPFYDAFLDLATRAPRARSLGQLADLGAGRVLLLGVGTGLDLPHLPARHHYVGLDLTPAMLARARRRARPGRTDLVQGDAMRLPFSDAAFDAVVLHLILAVVPHPESSLAEVARVLRPGGVALVFDKFLRPGQSGGWRRLVNPVVRRVATRLDVVFEEVLRAAPALSVRRDEPAMAGGWFRLIRLERR